MNGVLIQLIVLAGVLVFLILRLRSVLGTREGFEKPVVRPEDQSARRPALEVIEGGPDRDITDHVPEFSPSAKALATMKRIDPDFNVGGFLQGARSAYEMILMGFERGNLDAVQPFISADVFEAFTAVIDDRKARGLSVEAEFIGISETALQEAEFDTDTNEAEISIRFTGEYTYTVKNAEGEVVEGGGTTPKRQRDVWTFARKMGTTDPNWVLVATGE